MENNLFFGSFSFLASSGFDIAISLLLVVAGIAAGAWLFLLHRNHRDAAAAALDLVSVEGSGDKTPRAIFFEKFAGIDAALGDDEAFGGPWRRFRYTIAPNTVDNGMETDSMIVSTAPSPAEYFNPATLGFERWFAASIPGAFFAVGALLAGLGLAVALGRAAIAYAGADPTTAPAVVGAAVGAVSGKLVILFVAGLVALALRYLAMWTRSSIAGDVARFNAGLTESMLFASPESIGVRRQDALHFQSKSLQTLGEELASNIGTATRAAILEGYADLAGRLETLAGSYETLIAGAQKGAEDAIQKGFKKTVDASAAEIVGRMEAVAETLAGLPSRMEQGFQTSVDITTRDVLDRMEAVSTALAEIPARVEAGISGAVDASTQAALSRLETVAETMAEMPLRMEEGFKAAVDTSTRGVVARMEIVSDAMAGMPTRLERATVALENAGAGLASEQQGFVTGMHQHAMETAASTAQTIAGSVKEATQEALSEVLDIAGKVSEALVRLPDRLDSAYKALENANEQNIQGQISVAKEIQSQARNVVAASTATITQAVDRLAKEIDSSVVVSLAETTKTIQSVSGQMVALPSRIENILEALGSANDQIGETHERLLADMRDRTQEMNEATVRAIADGVAENTSTFLSKLEESNDSLRERAQALSNIFATLARTSDQIADRQSQFLVELQNGMRSLAVTASKTIADEVGRKSAELIDQLREFDTAFAARIESLVHLSERAGETEARLADVIDRVSAENEHIAQQVAAISNSLQSASRNVEQSAGGFAGNVAEMQETLSAFHRVSRETVETVGVSQRNIKETIGALHNLWQTHVARFDEVDDKLGRTFAELSRQIDQQTRAMREQVVEIDGTLAQAVSHLGELVEELSAARGTYRGDGYE